MLVLSCYPAGAGISNLPINSKPAGLTSSMISVILLFALIGVVVGQVLSPACYDNCILASCTDITHLNCVCNNEATTIHLCVLASCDTTDQILAQQAQASVCGSTSLQGPESSNFAGNSTSSANASASASVSQSSAPSTSLLSSTAVPANTSIFPTSTQSSQTAAPNSVSPAVTATSALASNGLSAAAKGGIIGGVLGGVLLFASIIGLFVILRRRKVKNRELRSAPLAPQEDKESTEMTTVAALRYPEDGEPQEIGGRLRNHNGGVAQ
jgi:hypothetical protein